MPDRTCEGCILWIKPKPGEWWGECTSKGRAAEQIAESKQEVPMETTAAYLACKYFDPNLTYQQVELLENIWLKLEYIGNIIP